MSNSLRHEPTGAAASVGGNAPRNWRRPVAVLATLTALLLASVHGSAAQAGAETAVKGDVALSVSGGYTRLVVHLQQEVEAKVRISNNVLIISFTRPVDVVVDRLSSGVSEFIGAARRDPDGRAIRLALTRRVRLNTMPAGERLFVDLLPETWNGVLPGLPQDVVEELARRARDAERVARQQRIVEQQRKQPPIRVRVARLPTFTRFIFRLPDKVGVSSDREAEALTLTFDAPLKYDLADALVDLPPAVKEIASKPDAESVAVRFTFDGQIDLRTFREDANYVVDVVRPDGVRERDAASTIFEGLGTLDDAKTLPGEAPATVPAKPEPSAKPELSSKPELPLKPELSSKPMTRAEPAPPAAPPAAAAELSAPRAAPIAEKSMADAPAQEAQAPAPPAAQPAGAPARAPASRSAAPRAQGDALAVKVTRQGETLKVDFPFAEPTPAAVFRRADTIWLVFDATQTLDLDALRNEPGHSVRSADIMTLPQGRAVRLKLERPRLASMSPAGTGWTLTIAGIVAEPAQPLALTRNIVSASRSNIVIPFDEPNRVHRIADPEIGDDILVVSALGPARAVIKEQDFVDLDALATAHGVVIAPTADDVSVDLSADKIVIGRPGGLSLSDGAFSGRQVRLGAPAILNAQQWGFDRHAPFGPRQSELLTLAAEAPPAKRLAARMNLARFYLARDLLKESKAVLDVAMGDDHLTNENAGALILHAVACAKGGRPDLALNDLSNPLIGDQTDAKLWRGYAHARQGRWSEARDEFRNATSAVGALPIELQRDVLIDAARASIEVNDFADAAMLLNELETIGIAFEQKAGVAVLTGRLAEGLSHRDEALAAYRAAAESQNRPAAAQGRLREISLRYALGDLQRSEVLNDLERLTTAWRGDQTEVEAMQLLAHLYTQEDRYRDAFYVVRAALKAHPNSEMTRRIQDEAVATFDKLFLSAKGADLPAVEALGLFYDFRELTPVGRRGDEMIRRLADRLVSVDLLDQASELLQYQVDNRLQGAARSQIAVRLAVIYLMNRKPERALGALRASRGADLSNELRNQRMLVESRALSDTGRHDLALEVIANLKGREAIRLRSDIHWAAKRWNTSAELLELFLGDRWNNFAPLKDTDRGDVLRAAVGFALGGDRIGLSRLRERYAVKMADGPDRRAFDVVTTAPITSSGEFGDVAKTAAAVDTLVGFLRELRTRYPETGPLTADRGGKPDGKKPPAIQPAAAAEPAPARGQRQASAR